MSRGRGRGRGRGGSNSARDNFNAAFKDMSKEDSRALFESFSKPVKGSGMLYPVRSLKRAYGDQRLTVAIGEAIRAAWHDTL